MSTSHHVGPGVGYGPIHSAKYKFWLDICYGFTDTECVVIQSSKFLLAAVHY